MKCKLIFALSLFTATLALPINVPSSTSSTKARPVALSNPFWPPREVDAASSDPFGNPRRDVPASRSNPFWPPRDNVASADSDPFGKPRALKDEPEASEPSGSSSILSIASSIPSSIPSRSNPFWPPRDNVALGALGDEPAPSELSSSSSISSIASSIHSSTPSRSNPFWPPRDNVAPGALGDEPKASELSSSSSISPSIPSSVPCTPVTCGGIKAGNPFYPPRDVTVDSDPFFPPREETTSSIASPTSSMPSVDFPPFGNPRGLGYKADPF